MSSQTFTTSIGETSDSMTPTTSDTGTTDDTVGFTIGMVGLFLVGGRLMRNHKRRLKIRHQSN
ncbi:MAG: hypothetical protein IH840_03655 [Candidatus Heimdallarchaeota archaeon]|nr:hypothetical protein [Candidatus Heimdallarchaeota archaeon]